MRSQPGITPPPDDNAEVPQLYEYDAVTGELVRVTKGEDGFNDDGVGVSTGVSSEPLESARLYRRVQIQHLIS